jgi:hypothetical protein
VKSNRTKKGCALEGGEKAATLAFTGFGEMSLGTTEAASSLPMSTEAPSIKPSSKLVALSWHGVSRPTVLIDIAELAVAGGRITWRILTLHPQLYAYRGYSDFVYAVAWSPDGK